MCYCAFRPLNDVRVYLSETPAVCKLAAFHLSRSSPLIGVHVCIIIPPPTPPRVRIAGVNFKGKNLLLEMVSPTVRVHV